MNSPAERRRWLAGCGWRQSLWLPYFKYMMVYFVVAGETPDFLKLGDGVTGKIIIYRESYLGELYRVVTKHNSIRSISVLRAGICFDPFYMTWDLANRMINR